MRGGCDARKYLCWEGHPSRLFVVKSEMGREMVGMIAQQTVPHRGAVTRGRFCVYLDAQRHVDHPRDIDIIGRGVL